MSRISRVSPNLRANRIRTNHVNRLDRGSAINRVEALSPIEKGKNERDLPSENYLNSYERYYRKFHELKKEFRKFYHQEKELLEAIQHLDENQQRFARHTNDLIDKYNQALQALADFDFVAGTNHVAHVRSVLQSFSKELAQIGITEDESGLLHFDAKVFAEFLTNDQETIEHTLLQFKSMILQNYKSFTKIQLENKKKNPYEQQPFQYKGLIIEEQS